MMLNLQLTELTYAGKEYTQNRYNCWITALFELLSITPFTSGISSTSFTKFSDLVPFLELLTGLIQRC